WPAGGNFERVLLQRQRIPDSLGQPGNKRHSTTRTEAGLRRLHVGMHGASKHNRGGRLLQFVGGNIGLLRDRRVYQQNYYEDSAMPESNHEVSPKFAPCSSPGRAVQRLTSYLHADIATETLFHFF